jgi:hypothetical protein
MAKVRRTTDKRWMFQCPACGCAHGPNDSWGFNGDREKPTFTPSIKVTGVKDLTDEEYERVSNGEKLDRSTTICHLFVTDGKIQFLSDCTHELAGQTVEIPDWDESVGDARLWTEHLTDV